MPSLFNLNIANNILQRINHLQPNNVRQWGKMDAAQMMAHCSNVFEMSIGDKKQKRNLFSIIMGPLIKKMVMSPKPYKPGLPTGKDFVIASDKDFYQEKERLLNLFNRFLEMGGEAVAKNEHALFGKLTAHEWGFTMWKHLDHHLRQFSA